MVGYCEVVEMKKTMQNNGGSPHGGYVGGYDG